MQVALGKYTKEAFKEHLEENPHIWEMFERFALMAARKREYYSAKAIIHRMRWQTEIEEKGGEFKLSDGWISHYARKFMEDHPEHDGFFRTTTRKYSYFNEPEKEPKNEKPNFFEWPSLQNLF
jgi:hypothetical protein